MFLNSLAPTIHYPSPTKSTRHGQIELLIDSAGVSATGRNRGIKMPDKILEKMKKGVYYPGNHLGQKRKLSDMVEKGYLKRMDGSFLCGPDSQPNYCLTDKGLSYKDQRLK